MTNEMSVDPEELRRLAEAATQQWAKSMMDKGGIERVISDALDSQLQTIIAKFLGFDKRWGDTWEVDHCNGRNGDSYVGAEVRSRAAALAQDWIHAVLKDVKPTAAQREAVRKDYRDQLLRSARQLAQESAHRHANEAVEEALAETLSLPKPMYDSLGNEIGEARYENGQWILVSSTVEDIAEHLALINVPKVFP